MGWYESKAKEEFCCYYYDYANHSYFALTLNFVLCLNGNKTQYSNAVSGIFILSYNKYVIEDFGLDEEEVNIENYADYNQTISPLAAYKKYNVSLK